MVGRLGRKVGGVGDVRRGWLGRLGRRVEGG